MPASPEQCVKYRARLKIRARKAVSPSGVKECSRCGRKRGLQFAHTKPTGLSGMGRGLTARMLDVIRNPDCYDLLCGDCHAAFDSAKEPTGEQ